MTWFRRMQEVKWFEVKDAKNFAELTKNIIHYVAGIWQMV